MLSSRALAAELVHGWCYNVLHPRLASGLDTQTELLLVSTESHQTGME